MSTSHSGFIQANTKFTEGEAMEQDIRRAKELWLTRKLTVC